MIDGADTGRRIVIGIGKVDLPAIQRIALAAASPRATRGAPASSSSQG
mgnify:CR=1 FL=1